MQNSVPPARFERTAPGLGILCSIHLSYGGEAMAARTYRVHRTTATTPPRSDAGPAAPPCVDEVVAVAAYDDVAARTADQCLPTRAAVDHHAFSVKAPALSSIRTRSWPPPADTVMGGEEGAIEREVRRSVVLHIDLEHRPARVEAEAPAGRFDCRL